MFCNKVQYLGLDGTESKEGEWIPKHLKLNEINFWSDECLHEHKKTQQQTDTFEICMS